jgi:hypothetical protein
VKHIWVNQGIGICSFITTKYTAILYREVQGLQRNPCNENRIPAMRTGFPVMKTGFSLGELTYREFPVSLTGFGFAVYQAVNIAWAF